MAEKQLEYEFQIMEVLGRINFGPSFPLKAMTWVLSPMKHGGCFLSYRFLRPDRETGEEDWGESRQEWIPKYSTPSAVVKTAFVIAKLTVEHEVMEGFLYEGVRLFDPHYPVEDLMVAARWKVPPKGDFGLDTE